MPYIGSVECIEVTLHVGSFMCTAEALQNTSTLSASAGRAGHVCTFAARNNSAITSANFMFTAVVCSVSLRQNCFRVIVS